MSGRVLTASSALVLGGARSGKTAYALRLAEAAAPERLYLATAEARDDEMEAPLQLIEALTEEARPRRVVMVDCLTLWLSNLMLAEQDAEAEAARLAASIGALKGPVVFVSNEVGFGIVPENALARQFRDIQGRAILGGLTLGLLCAYDW